MAPSPAKVRTCLWMQAGGRRAAEFYVSLLPDSRVDSAASDEADPLVTDFTLAGAPYQILTAGPHYTLSPAASISVLTEDQAETDRLWEALSEDGAEMACGWLTDRFGLSWQIVPRRLVALLGDDDKGRAERARQAMMGMQRIDIAALEAAADNGGS